MKKDNKIKKIKKQPVNRLEEIRRLKMEHNLEFRNKLEALLKEYNKELRIIFVDKDEQV